MSFLSIRNLEKYYGETCVFKKVSLVVEKGSFCTLVGASGCGKSTFLRILIGQETPTKGTIYLGGKPLREEPDQERGIVFQRYSLYPHLTVRDNVILGLEFVKSPFWSRFFGAKRRHAYEEVEEILSRVGLTHAAKKYAGELSGGMQQRAAIAQALVLNPPVLLLDEPFGALDPGITKDMHELILQLWKEKNLTIFMVTHDISEAFSLGTRVLVMDKMRYDGDNPHLHAATITYDIPLNDRERKKEQQNLINKVDAKPIPGTYVL